MMQTEESKLRSALMSSEKECAQLQLALLTALLKIEESDDEHDRKWCALIRARFGFPEKVYA